MSHPENFPIMGCNIIASIPWAILAPHEEQAQRNHGQTLKRLAERGGLAPCEAIAIIKGMRWGSVKPCQENDMYLINLVREFRANAARGQS